MAVASTGSMAGSSALSTWVVTAICDPLGPCATIDVAQHVPASQSVIATACPLKVDERDWLRLALGAADANGAGNVTVLSVSTPLATYRMRTPSDVNACGRQ